MRATFPARTGIEYSSICRSVIVRYSYLVCRGTEGDESSKGDSKDDHKKYSSCYSYREWKILIFDTQLYGLTNDLTVLKQRSFGVYVC